MTTTEAIARLDEFGRSRWSTLELTDDDDGGWRAFDPTPGKRVLPSHYDRTIRANAYCDEWEVSVFFGPVLYVTRHRSKTEAVEYFKRVLEDFLE